MGEKKNLQILSKEENTYHRLFFSVLPSIDYFSKDQTTSSYNPISTQPPAPLKHQWASSGACFQNDLW